MNERDWIKFKECKEGGGLTGHWKKYSGQKCLTYHIIWSLKMLNYAQNNVHSNKLWEGNFFIQEKLNVKYINYFLRDFGLACLHRALVVTLNQNHQIIIFWIWCSLKWKK